MSRAFVEAVRSINDVVEENKKAGWLFCDSPEYIDAKNNRLSDFCWEISEYTVVVSVQYGKEKIKSFTYEFIVTEQNSIVLCSNIDESLFSILKDYYRVPRASKSSIVVI